MKPARDRFEFYIKQGGIIVAKGSGDDMERVASEARHYAAIYGQDGPVLLATRGFQIEFPSSPTEEPHG